MEQFWESESKGQFYMNKLQPSLTSSLR